MTNQNEFEAIRLGAMDTKNFLINNLMPLKIDSTITRDSLKTPKSSTNNPLHSKKPHEIPEADGKETRLSNQLKDQMTASYNRIGYIVNNNQLGTLSKKHVPEESPESPMIITHKKGRMQQ